jgi:phage FluMu protein Com
MKGGDKVLVNRMVHDVPECKGVFFEIENEEIDKCPHCNKLMFDRETQTSYVKKSYSRQVIINRSDGRLKLGKWVR